jgi:hypothetical protein
MTSAEARLREELAELMHLHFVRTAQRVLTAAQDTNKKDYNGILELVVKKYSCLPERQKFLPFWHADEVLSLLRDLGALR